MTTNNALEHFQLLIKRGVSCGFIGPAERDRFEREIETLKTALLDAPSCPMGDDCDLTIAYMKGAADEREKHKKDAPETVEGKPAAYMVKCVETNGCCYLFEREGLAKEFTKSKEGTGAIIIPLYYAQSRQSAGRVPNMFGYNDVGKGEAQALETLHRNLWGEDVFWMEKIKWLFKEYITDGYDDVLAVIDDRFQKANNPQPPASAVDVEAIKQEAFQFLRVVNGPISKDSLEKVIDHLHQRGLIGQPVGGEDAREALEALDRIKAYVRANGDKFLSRCDTPFADIETIAHALKHHAGE